jgi:hypothetical protein
MTDHTKMYWLVMGGNVFEHNERDVYYKDYAKFEYLPPACQGDGVKKEYEEYWKHIKSVGAMNWYR